MGKILIVAEKPAAGSDIAKVVGAKEKHQGYLEGDEYVVTWAIGHLIGLKHPSEHDEKYKKWHLQNLPLSFDLSDSLKVLPDTSYQYKVIKNLIHRNDIDMLINAGDAGREGYLIQEWIYRMAGCTLPKKVLWASSLTTAGIKNAMNHLKDSDLPEFQGILREAEARAEGDYILGFNYSPLLTITRAYKQTLSYGRCQTPLLNLVAVRDEEIRNFRSMPYWDIQITYSKGFKGMLVDENGKNKHFRNKAEAESIIKSCKGQGLVTLYQNQAKKEKPPLLYNLAKLQQDMGKKYSFSPDKTLTIAQSLYEKHKILSYPRTDSQHLSMDVYDEIAEHLKCCRFGAFTELIDKIELESIKADKSYFNDLKVTDHHALIPTIHTDMDQAYGCLNEDEKRVFDAVVLSLIAIFYPEYCYDATKILVDMEGNHFMSQGTTIRQLGYRALFANQANHNKPKASEMQILPTVQEGSVLSVDSSEIIPKKTEPPKKYNDETIVKIMEKYNIGTSATRAEIIKKLQNPKRQFLIRQEGKYSITELGKEYIKIVPPELKAPELTQKFEEDLQKVNKGTLEKEEFLGSLLEDIQTNMDKFIANPIPDEQKIGYAAMKEREAAAQLGKCPKCGAEIVSGQYGAYCTGKCGMNVGRAMGAVLTDAQAKSMLEGKKTFVKGLKGKKGAYDAYLIPEGIEEFSYTKDGKEIRGFQYKVRLEFPQKKKQ
ncbi:MAG: DNA topoisomerase [Clostridiales bacterium]|nr:DNA topoisomerase [Clostridiales bacterium]